MADPTTPLLKNSDASLPAAKRPPSLDDTIENCIGSFNWSQFLQAILVSFAWVFDAQQTFISVFTDAQPSWHCTENATVSSCTSNSNICQIPKESWSWDFAPQTSIISEWNLQCANSLIKGLPASSFFAGCLLGGAVLATLADSSLGRKNSLLLSCLIMSLASLLTIFSSNIWIYSFLRFVNGFGRATIGTCALVLSTELVGKRWRGQVGVVGFFCFTFGFLSLPVLAYLNRGKSWRNLLLYTSIPTFFYCFLVKLLVNESPRWLFVRGRKTEAIATLKSMATAPETVAAMSFSNLMVEDEDLKKNDTYSAIKVLIEKWWAFRRLSAMMVTGFGIGLVYYGMPLGLGSLDFNLYLSVTLNALSELPSSLITFFLIGKLSRKKSLLGFTIGCGICSVLCVFAGEISGNLQMGLELVSFFFAVSAFNMELIYTIELFPTCVRNTAIAMVRQALVLGGVISPVLVAAGRTNGFLSYGVFGVTVGLCGLTVVGLPETRGGTLSDTIDEEENKGKGVGILV